MAPRSSRQSEEPVSEGPWAVLLRGVSAYTAGVCLKIKRKVIHYNMVDREVLLYRVVVKQGFP